MLGNSVVEGCAPVFQIEGHVEVSQSDSHHGMVGALCGIRVQIDFSFSDPLIQSNKEKIVGEIEDVSRIEDVSGIENVSGIADFVFVGILLSVCRKQVFVF